MGKGGHSTWFARRQDFVTARRLCLFFITAETQRRRENPNAPRLQCSCEGAAGKAKFFCDAKPPGSKRNLGLAESLLGIIMRARLFIAFLFMMPLVVHANPVSINGQSLIAFAIVAFWALVIESGIVTFSLFSCGFLIVPLFGTLILANVAFFLFAFLPLTGRVSLWFLEPGVVLADACLVKLVASAPFVQSGGFIGVSWRRAFVASLLGNVASFFVGVLASGAPWIDP